jgi:hypothetical protein
VLTTEDGKALTLPWSPGKPLQLAPGRYTLADVQSNGPAGMVQVFASNTPLTLGQAFSVTEKDSIVLRQATTFADMGSMGVSGKGLSQVSALGDVLSVN